MTFSTIAMDTLKCAIKLTLNQGHINKYTLSKQDITFLFFFIC